MQNSIQLNTKSYQISTNIQNELQINAIDTTKDYLIIHKNQSTIYDFLKAS